MPDIMSQMTMYLARKAQQHGNMATRSSSRTLPLHITLLSTRLTFHLLSRHRIIIIIHPHLSSLHRTEGPHIALYNRLAQVYPSRPTPFRLDRHRIDIDTAACPPHLPLPHSVFLYIRQLHPPHPAHLLHPLLPLSPLFLRQIHSALPAKIWTDGLMAKSSHGRKMF